MLVTGPVVNAAARLQAAAGPGEVLAGETTVALTANAVSYGDRRQATAKGFHGDTIAGFPVQTLTPRSARRTIPFVGRSSELAILRESLHRATSTGHPVLVSVLGEPGIGKSRLADELVAGLDDDVPVLTGRARPFTDTATFAPAATIVAELAGLEEDEPPEKTRRRIHELADRTVPPGDAKRSSSGSRSCSGWPSGRRTRRSCRTCRPGSSRSSTASRARSPPCSCSRTRTSSVRRCSS
jgi:hypothetical protein